MCLHAVESVAKLEKYLVNNDTQHRGFPIINEKHHLIGMIPRNFIIAILKDKNFYHKKQSEY